MLLDGKFQERAKESGGGKVKVFVSTGFMELARLEPSEPTLKKGGSQNIEPTAPTSIIEGVNKSESDVFALLTGSVAAKVGFAGANCETVSKSRLEPSEPGYLYIPSINCARSRVCASRGDIERVGSVGSSENVVKNIKGYLQGLPAWIRSHREAQVYGLCLLVEEFEDEEAAAELARILAGWTSTNWRALPRFQERLIGESAEAWVDRIYAADGNFGYLPPQALNTMGEIR